MLATRLAAVVLALLTVAPATAAQASALPSVFADLRGLFTGCVGSGKAAGNGLTLAVVQLTGSRRSAMTRRPTC